MRIAYSDKLDATIQVDVEEEIASTIADHWCVSIPDEEANALGRSILYHVLRRFRPDLFEDEARE